MSVIRPFTCTILCLFLIAGCAQDPNKLTESGKQYLAAGKYREASLDLRTAINLNPQLADAHYYLGIAHLNLGNALDANREFETTIALAPGNVGARLNYGNLQLLDGKFQEARAAAELILKDSPSNVRALILLANTDAGMISLDDSIQEVRKLFELEPRLQPSYLDLTPVTNPPRQSESGEESYKRAISVDAKSALAHLALSNFYLRSQRFALAEQELHLALALDHKSTDVARAFGFLYMQTQKLDLAEKAFAELANSLAPDPAPQIVLADFYNQIGRTPKAIETLQALIATNSKYPIAKRRLADLLVQQKDYAKAAETVEQLLKENPNDVDAQFIKGRIRLEQRKTTEAIADLEKIVTARPRSPVGRFFLGYAYLQAGEFQRAESEFLAAIQNDSSFVQPYLSLADIRLKSGDPEGAVRYARQALSLNSNLNEAFLILSRAYIAMNNFRSAANEINDFLRKSPGSAAGLYHLGLLNLARGNLADAEAQLEGALKGNAELADGLTALTSLHIRQNRPERAIQRVNQAIEQNPSNAGYYVVLAQLYLSQDNKTKAEEAFEKTVSLDPSDIYRRMDLAAFYRTTGGLDKSVATLRQIIIDDPSNLIAKVRLGDVFIQRKEYDAALQIADEILKTNLQSTDALVLKGRVLLGHNKTMEAISQLQTAVQNEPNSGLPSSNSILPFAVLASVSLGFAVNKSSANFNARS